MSTEEFELGQIPSDERAMQVFMQHGVGFTLFENVRKCAVEKIDPRVSEEAKATAKKAVDDAMYALMQLIDGVSRGLQNESSELRLDFVVRLISRNEADEEEVKAELDLREQGDGFCAGYHGWLEGDFGKNEVAKAR